jgi:hypothetical protein
VEFQVVGKGKQALLQVGWNESRRSLPANSCTYTFTNSDQPHFFAENEGMHYLCALKFHPEKPVKKRNVFPPPAL